MDDFRVKPPPSAARQPLNLILILILILVGWLCNTRTIPFSLRVYAEVLYHHDPAIR